SLNATFLGRTATVVRNRRHVGNVGDLESGVVQGAHGGLTTGARALDLNVQVLEAVFLRGDASFLSGDLRGERGALAGAAETGTTRGRPAQGVTLAVGNGDDGVVERGMHVGDAVNHSTLRFLASRFCGCLGHKIT